MATSQRPRGIPAPKSALRNTPPILTTWKDRPWPRCPGGCDRSDRRGCACSKCRGFGPALGVKTLPAADAESYLRAAIAYANDDLWGRLGRISWIHPATMRQIGAERFEESLPSCATARLASTAGAPSAPDRDCAVGAFPGHTPEDIQSGTGVVHNAFMLENTERTIVRAPWAPFPRGFFSREMSLMPHPPFFINNRNQTRIGKALTRFQYRPSWRKLPGLLREVLRG